MSLLSSQHVVLIYENFEFISDEIFENSDVTLNQLSVAFWCDFFKQVFAAATEFRIPALSAMANAIFDPSSKFAREFILFHVYGQVKVYIH